ncbi:MAG: hydrolase [Mucilaginibacter sp.]|nr:hydrolase [Mucilaginibacter sp.]
MIISVTAAIINRAGKILIARRAKHKHLGGYWEFPGGKIEANETPEICLKRELAEELQIEVKIEKFFMENLYIYPQITVLLKSYLCTFISGEIQLIDHDEVLWVNKDQLGSFNFAPADIPIIQQLHLK